MGQGRYIALSFGILDPPEGEDGDEIVDGYDEAIEKAAGRYVKHAYESERNYMAIFVAENAGLYDDRTIVPVTCKLCDAATGKAWKDAEKAWKRVQKASAKLGFPLPDGQPLLIVDYD